MPHSENSPLAFTINESAQTSKLSRSTIYRAIKSGELRAVKYHKRTLILADDLRKLLNNLPEVERSAA